MTWISVRQTRQKKARKIYSFFPPSLSVSLTLPTKSNVLLLLLGGFFHTSNGAKQRQWQMWLEHT